MIETLVKQIEKLAGIQPDKTAVVFKNEQLSYAKLNEKIRDIASRMFELGIKKGDRVLFSAVSKPEFVAVYQAVQYIGAIAVFVDKNAAAASAADIYMDAGAKIFFTDKPLKEFADRVYVYSMRKIYEEKGEKPIDYSEPAPEDIAELIYTSGTTGKPKGCMLSYRAIHRIWMNTIDGIGMKPEDITLIPLPLNHSFALRVLRSCMYLGATVVLQNGFTFAKEIENNLDRFSCNSVVIVPASVETILKQMQDKFSEIVGRFERIEVSAGALTLEQRKKMVELLPDTEIHNTWGSSESGGAIFLNVTDTVRNHSSKIESLGKPIEGVEIRVLDDEGRPIESDSLHPGRMAIRGEMQMDGYWNKEDLNKKTIVDGWLLTSDMIYLDEDGYLYMLGRADDIINVGGEKVSPVEVENAAGEYAYISECACIGVDDPEGVLGKVPVLFVVAKNNHYDKDELRQFLLKKLERYKVPVEYIEVIELPRNSMQKINRSALKVMWEKRDDALSLNETLKTILTRRSIRRFTDKSIERDILELIIKCGYYAPSGHNLQTWRFTVVSTEKRLTELKEAARQAAKENHVHFYGWENPAAIILVSNDSRNVDGCQDASCAAENIMLAAWSLGIGSVWLNPLMTLRDKQPVKRVLDEMGIPQNHTVWSTVALGYPVNEGMMLKKNSDVIHWIE